MAAFNNSSTVVFTIPSHTHGSEINFIFELIINFIVLNGLAILGTVANIINIIVFCKIGFKESINVNLVMLAVFDGLGCLFLVGVILLSIFRHFHVAFPLIDTFAAQVLFTAYPRISLVRCASIIAALIAIERCICVLYPFKVKGLFTTKRVTTINFLLLVSLLAPYYSIQYKIAALKWVHFPATNTSMFIFLPKYDGEGELFSFCINVILPVSLYAAIAITTVVLVHTLQKISKWRQANTSTNSSSSATDTSASNKADTKAAMSHRDSRVTKTVAMISTLYIACNAPVLVHTLLWVFDESLRPTGPSSTPEGRRMMDTFNMFTNCLETINAGANIFIYYHTSTNYKNVFNQIFCHEKLESINKP